MSRLVNNPAWVTSAIASAFEEIETKLPPAWLPRLSGAHQAGSRRIAATMQEYGCGVHGCVLPTMTPDIVLKVTDDASEVQFATDLAPSLVAPVVVDYYAVMALSAKRKGIPLYLLWRESAHDVGDVDKIVGPEADESISIQHRRAQMAHLAFLKNRLEDAEYEIGQWRQAALEMAKFPELATLALGMIKIWDEQSIFFGDLHGGNLGRVTREGTDDWVITDPGHVLVIQEDFARATKATTLRSSTARTSGSRAPTRTA